MLRVNYAYEKGVLFVRLFGVLDSENIYLLISSLKRIIGIGGIIYTVINLENVKILNSNYISMILEKMMDNKIYLCGYKSSNCNGYQFLRDETKVFKYINF